MLARLFVAFVFALPIGVAEAASITVNEAAAHVGEYATVCGQVASTNYASQANGQPTFLDMGRAYPNQLFTVVIFGSDRGKFGSPEVSFRGKAICVTGEIQPYQGKPEIILHDPNDLTSQ